MRKHRVSCANATVTCTGSGGTYAGTGQLGDMCTHRVPRAITWVTCTGSGMSRANTGCQAQPEG